MTWTPTATVSIGGADYTAAALEGATLTLGRTDTYSQPSAGYATVTVLTVAGDDIQPGLGDRVTISLDDSAGQPVRLFTGTVQSWQSATTSRGDIDVIQTTVTAVGPLSRMARRQVTATRSEETDGDRILWLIEQGLGVPWEGWQPLTGTWAEVAADVTWADAGPDTSEIDAGIYDVAALTGGGETNAYTEAAEASGSGQGVLYETRSGAIGWANADRRITNAASPLDLDPGEVSADVSSRSDFADLVNQLALTYDGGEVTATNTVSIGLFGRNAASLTTTLADVSAAGDVAALYLTRHAFPSAAITDVTIRLDTPNMADALIDDLLEIEVNRALRFTDLPFGLGNVERTVFVEGVRWTLGRRTTLTLTVSPESLSTGPARWTTVSGTLAWTDVSPTLEWQDARSL